jgi:hypothetical protein
MGRCPWTPLGDGALRAHPLLHSGAQIAPQSQLLHPQDKNLATALNTSRKIKPQQLKADVDENSTMSLSRFCNAELAPPSPPDIIIMSLSH